MKEKILDTVPNTCFTNEDVMNSNKENGDISNNQNISEETVSQKNRKEVLIIRAKKPMFTYILIAVNIIMWAFLNFYSLKSGKSYNELLSIFGAKINLNIIKGQYWRFITPVFLHADITHLLINCYSLYAVGVTVERIYGNARFLIVYLVAGVMGSILSFMFSINSAVGASGAIFGLLGALLYFGVEHPKLFRAYFGHSIIMTIGINLVYGFINTGIDNYGHIGGLMGGFLASGIVKAPIKTKWYLSKMLFIVLTLAIGISGLIYGFNNANNNAIVKLDELYKYDQNQNWNEAAKTGQEILRLKSTNRNINIEALWITAKAETLTSNYDKAVEHAQILAELSPKDGHYLLGVIYYNMGQLNFSKEELLKAKAMNAQYSNIDELVNNIEKHSKNK